MPRLAAVFLLILLLGACAEGAAPPQPEVTIAETAPTVTLMPTPQPSEPVPASKAPGGEWTIIEVFGTGSSGAGGTGQVGQRLHLDVEEATDALGRACLSPTYVATQATEAEFLGAPVRVERSEAPARTMTVIDINCGGDAFARFATWRDGSLLTRAGGAILRLERVEPSPSPPPPAISVAALPEMAKQAAPPSPPPPTGQKLVYLASFNGTATADRGWRRLAARSALLASMVPVTKTVDLPGRGRFVRLFAKVGDAAQAGRLCAELKRQLPDCGITWR